ncbi:hypothetical protein [Thalassotalea sp. G2M2-11]|uniref:hypothetical protein n=1 Tax=Thalassotalea sp. G2M2-11 TaxID=2787627 RepID=UPI0019D1781A|nr:hypothetical protein [Thalassotalea sp. G2M2-11]
MDKPLSTDTVNASIFRPHGRIEIYSEHALLFIKAVGPFNKEIVDALNTIEKDIILDKIDTYGYWSELVEFEHSCIITPETQAAHKKYLTKMNNNGIAPKKSAFWIPSNVEGSNMMPSVYQSIYKQCGIDMQVFPDRDAALAWLTQDN